MSPMQRLTEALQAACPPIYSVGGGPTSVDVQYLPAATEQQRAAAAAVVVAFDWSEAAQQTWERQRKRAAAKAAVQAATDDPLSVVTRAFAEATRKQINALRVLPLVGLATLTPLAWAKLVADEIDAGSGD